MTIRDEILAVEKRRQEALKAVDMVALEAMFSDDLIHVHTNGMVHRKAEILAHIESRRAFIAIERDDLEVMACGECALLSGPMKSLMRTPSGNIQMVGWVTQVLRNEGGTWRFISFQFTLNQPR